MQRWRRGLIWFLLLAFLTGTPPSLQAQGERLVLAFYCATFDEETWMLPLPDQPLNPYRSSDAASIEAHVIQARQTGIDALIMDWDGPSGADNQTELNFRVLLAKSMAHGLRAAVAVDVTVSTLTTLDAVGQALTVVRQQHALHAAYLHVAGKPAVFFQHQEQYPVGSWGTLRQQVDPARAMIWLAEGADLAYLEVFDGLYPRNVAEWDDPGAMLASLGDEVRHWSREHDVQRVWVATVLPGYDDRVTGGAQTFVREREGDATYRTFWAGARQSDADWVLITSFNYWLAGTQIEPAQSYRNFYLDLTAELALQYRSSVPPTATAEPPPPTLTPTAPPSPLSPPQTPTPPPTMTPQITPTATLTPTATPFRLPVPAATPFPAAEDLLPAEAPTRPEVAGEHGGVTPTPLAPGRYPVEGQEPAPPCSLLPALLLWLPVAVTLLRRH